MEKMTKESGDHSSEFENRMKSLQEWWDSDECKKLQKANEEARQRAVGKYYLLSESEKLDMVEAITYIICKAEKEGTSHRGLQDALGIYPSGFWVDHLMDVHNALWSYYHEKDVETLKTSTLGIDEC